jgi:hypothetical protein
VTTCEEKVKITSKLKNIQEKLSDPMILEWALKRVEASRIANPAVADEIEQALFTEPVIQQLMEKDDPDVLAVLFATVSPERLRGSVNLMVERWPQWETSVASVCAEHIAILAPEEAEGLFHAYLASEESSDDTIDIGVMNGILAMAPQKGRDLARRLIDLNLPVEEKLIGDHYFDRLTALARAFGLPALPGLIGKALTSQISDWKFEERLENLYMELTGDVFLFWHAINFSERRANQSFRQLGFLFRENAPLKELDDLLSERVHKQLPKAAAFLEKHCRKHDAAIPVLTAYHSHKIGIKKENKKRIVQFLAALTAACLARESIDVSGLTLDGLLEQINVDIQLKVPYEHVQKIHSFPKEETIQLVLEMAQRNRGKFAKINLMAMMPQLGFPEFIPFLIDSLASKEKWVHDAAYFSLCRYGTAAESALTARFPAMSPMEKTNAIEVLRRVGGEASIQILFDSYQELRRKYLRQWCLAAQELPDVRFIELLKPELRRKQRWIDKTFLLLCLLLDQTPPQLIEVSESVEERRRLNPLETDEEFIKAPLRLDLECSLCGDRNDYEIKRVFVNPLRENDPPYFPEEITCLSCGRVAEMTLTPLGLERLLMEADFAMLQLKLNMEPEGALRLVTNQDDLPLKELLKKYQDALAQNANSIPDMLGLANCYDNLERTEEAEILYRRCWELDKTCIEAASKLADALILQDKKEAAFGILNEAFQQRSRWKFHKTENKHQLIDAIQDMYYALKGQLSPKKSVLSPAVLPKKNITAGRNDPCPCGSGKKYKKCCLSTKLQEETGSERESVFKKTRTTD